MAKPSLRSIRQRAKRDGWANWIRTESDERAVLNGCHFDLEAATRVRHFFAEMLCHSKGRWAGKPFELLDWQFNDVIGPIFGWKRADGRRRYRRAYVEIPKKNGKSTLAAGIAIYLLVADGEPGAHVFSAAADRDQASLVYNEAANMVQASDELSNALLVRRSNKRILYHDTHSVYEAISSDADTSEGLNAHGLILDELHAWQKREFYESLMYAGRAREQPLMFVITTAGSNMDGICYEQHQYAQGVIAGDIQMDRMFAYIRAAEDGDDWKDETTWIKANPSIGETLEIESIADDCSEAQDSPAKERAFKRYTLNIWAGAADGWLSMDDWEHPECCTPFVESDLYGESAYGGIDLSQSRDLSALVWVIPRDGLFYLVPRLYMPRGQVQRAERRDHVPYGAWIDQGFITTTPGDTIHQGTIRDDVLADVKRFRPKDIGYDAYNAQYLCEEYLENTEGLPMTSVAQSIGSMGPASTEFESLLKQRKLRHNGNPVLRWMASGCVAKQDDRENIQPIKKRSTTRIDGIVATIIALSRWMADRGTRGSVYNQRGVLSIG